MQPIRLFTIALATFAIAQITQAQDSVPTPDSSTPRSANVLSGPQLSYEEQIIREINRARTNPNAYADWLEAQRKYYEGMTLNLLGETPIETQEGTEALDEAINYLREARPLLPLEYSSGLSQGSQDRIEDWASGTPVNTSEFINTLSQYGRINGPAAEESINQQETAQTTVMMMILGDGDPSRSHRDRIFNIDYKSIGVGCPLENTTDPLCVLAYAGSYDESSPGNNTSDNVAVNPNVTPNNESANDPANDNTNVLLVKQGVLKEGESLVYPDDESLYNEHRFRGQAGQTILITLESEEFDPFLAIFDEAGEVLGQNDDADENTKNSQLTLTLPEDGVYRIFVNGYSSTDRGRYTVVIRDGNPDNAISPQNP